MIQTKCFNDNEYLDKYIELIISNEKTAKEKFKTQQHHIIPKRYYRVNKIRINNAKSNLVNLTYNSHVMAHYYLCKCSADKDTEISNIIPINIIAKNAHQMNEIDLKNLLVDYDELQEKMCRWQSENRKGKKLSQETLTKISISLKGHYVSEEHKKYLRTAHVGKKLSMETKQKLSLANKGKHYSRKTEFKKGYIPWNKGTKGLHNSPNTEFTRERTINENNPRAYQVYQYDKNGNFIAKYKTAKEASLFTGVNRSAICSCRCGKVKTAGGYLWKADAEQCPYKIE